MPTSAPKFSLLTQRQAAYTTGVMASWLRSMPLHAADVVDENADRCPEAADGPEEESASNIAQPGTTKPQSQEPAEPSCGSQAAGASQPAVMGSTGTTGSPQSAPLSRARASDNPILAIPLEQYFTVVQQLADEFLCRRGGGAPDGRLTGACGEAPAILEAHGLNGAACMTLLDQLETSCRRALGAASRVNQRAGAVAQRWFKGIGFCREVFVEMKGDGHT